MSRLLRAASLVLLPVLLIAGCNSSTADKDDKGGSASALASDDPIKIGGVVTKTSSTGTSKTDADLGAKARFMMANDQGGINGRKIDYVGAEDDSQDPAKTGSVLRKLVQQDKVFAVVPVNTVAINSAADFLNTNKTPYIGWGSSGAFCNKEYGIGFSGCLLPTKGSHVSTIWVDLVTAALGGNPQGKSVAIVAQDSDAAKSGMAMYQKIFQSVGFTVSYAKATVPNGSTPTDWSPWVGEVMASNNGKAPDVVVPMIPAPTNLGLFTALKRGGYPGLINDPNGADPGLLKQPASREALQDVLFYVREMPFETEDPEMAKFKEYISKAKGEPVTEWNFSMMVGWNSADLFVKIAEKAGPNLSVESFQAASANFEDYYPLVGKRQLPLMHAEGTRCGALLQLKGDQFVINQPHRCTDDPGVTL